jgi:hypothetical protein
MVLLGAVSCASPRDAAVPALPDTEVSVPLPLHSEVSATFRHKATGITSTLSGYLYLADDADACEFDLVEESVFPDGRVVTVNLRRVEGVSWYASDGYLTHDVRDLSRSRPVGSMAQASGLYASFFDGAVPTGRGLCVLSDLSRFVRPTDDDRYRIDLERFHAVTQNRVVALADWYVEQLSSPAVTEAGLSMPQRRDLLVSVTTDRRVVAAAINRFGGVQISGDGAVTSLEVSSDTPGLHVLTLTETEPRSVTAPVGVVAVDPVALHRTLFGE